MRMLRSYYLVVFLVLVGFASPLLAVWGTPDVLPSASLVVPFFEVGINSGTEPHDTLPVVYNRNAGSDEIIHWEVRNVDGVLSFSGNETIPGAGSWNGSLRDMIANESSVVERAMLIDGNFYRGFVTIDLVSAETNLTPFSAGYPFRNQNFLLGYVYYVRLLDGSANGLNMVHLEFTTETPDASTTFVDGFYDVPAGHREEIDARARECADRNGRREVGTCTTLTTDATIGAIRSRIFRLASLSGDSRVVVFVWDTSRPEQGGPSAICTVLGTCATTYGYNRRATDGSVLESGSLSLNHVVNVFEPAGPADDGGEYLIFDIEDPGTSMQTFAFSFNSASSPTTPGLNWDAIFESSIVP